MSMNYLRLVIGLLCMLSLLNCEKSCSKKIGEAEKLSIKETPKEPTELKEDMVTSFPKLNLKGLGDKEVNSLTKFFNDEVCPCGCPMTFAQCLNTEGCKP